MAKSLLLGGAYKQSTANTTQYWSVVGSVAGSTSEFANSIPIPNAGKVSKLSVGIISNTLSGGPMTVNLRKNGVTTGITLQVPAGTSGIFSDFVNEETIAVDDTVCLQTVPPATGTFYIASVSLLFEPNDAAICLSRFALTEAINWSSVSKFTNVMNGSFSVTSTNTTYPIMTLDLPGYFTDLDAYIGSTGKHLDIVLVKNNAAGNNALTVHSDSTGLFKEADGVQDLINGSTDNVYITAQLTEYLAGTKTVYFIAISFISTEKKFLIVHGRMIAAQPSNTKYYYSIAGRMNALGSYIESVTLIPIKAKWSNLSCRVATNSLDSGTSTIRPIINGVNGNQIIQIPAGTTGEFKDNVNIDNIEIDDQVGMEHTIAGTTGNSAISYVSMISEPIDLRNLTATVTHSIALTDTRNQKVFHNKIRELPTQTLAFSDTPLQNKTHLIRTITQTLAFSATSLRLQNLIRSSVETITLNDTVIRYRLLLGMFTDSIGISHSGFMTSRKGLKTISHSIAFTKTIKRIKTVNRSNPNIGTLSLSSTTKRYRSFNKLLPTNTISFLVSNIGKLRGLHHQTVDSVAFTSSSKKQRGIIQYITNSITLMHSAEKFVTILKTLPTHTLTVTHQPIKRLKTINRTFSNTIGFRLTSLVQMSKNIRGIVHTLMLSHTTSRIRQRNITKSRTETIGFTSSHILEKFRSFAVRLLRLQSNK